MKNTDFSKFQNPCNPLKVGIRIKFEVVKTGSVEFLVGKSNYYRYHKPNEFLSL